MLLFIPGLSAFGLGSWQLMRRQWKVELLEHRRNRLRDDIVPLDLALSSVHVDSGQKREMEEIQGDVLQSLEYKRVQCEGVYAEVKSIFLGPRGRTNHGVTERGYYLVTPLLPVQEESGNMQVPVLVNRGWVPGSWRDRPPKQISESNPGVDTLIRNEKANKGIFKSLWGKKHETSEVQKPKMKTMKVVGVIRGSENPNMFVPANEPASGQWFFVDVPAMARAVNLPEDTIYIEALQDKTVGFKGKEYPDPKDPETFISSSVMPYDHLNYAFTWFTLSAATTFMAWKRLLK